MNFKSCQVADNKGLVPFQVSCKSGYEEILNLLIDKIEPIELARLVMTDTNYAAPLHSLCKFKTEKHSSIRGILEKLKNFESQLNFSFDDILRKEDAARQTILHLAIENNHLNIVELLFRDYNMSRTLKEGQRGNLPIHVCAKSGSIDMFQMLQSYQAVSLESNSYLENALHVAAYFNKSQFIVAFLEYEKNVRDQSNANEAKEKDYLPCSKRKDLKGYTPFMTSVATLNHACFRVKSII